MADHTQASCPAQTLFPWERGVPPASPLCAGRDDYETREWRERGEGKSSWARCSRCLDEAAILAGGVGEIRDTACNPRQDVYGMRYVWNTANCLGDSQ